MQKRSNNQDFIKYTGYEESNPFLKDYFNDSTVDLISYKITELLQGVDPENRPIIVPKENIVNVMNNIYSSYRPNTGDIFGRYTIPSGTTTDSYIQNMIDQVIEVITSDVRTSILQETSNSRLSVWNTVYGDFNPHGLQQHSFIKVRNKRPTPFQFHMRY